MRRALTLLLIAAPAWAQPAPEAAPPEAAAPATEAPQLEPPRALGETTVPFPADAPPITEPVVVQVKIRVGPDGVVQQVDLLSAPQLVFDTAVVEAAKAFAFEPGRYGGQPVPVEITFSHTFLPPPPPPVAADEGPPRVSVLRGRLRELGTRAPVEGATVTAQVGERFYSAEADATGRFRLEVPAGEARVTIQAPGHLPFLQAETLAAQQELVVTYAVERERYDPYEIVVITKERRAEVSRVTLKGAEIKQVPGTFGDPFRVIQTLPGVVSVAALLPFPIVRGATPSSTGFLFDGSRVPLLYHLLAGPSVIHPEFIEEVDFYPGGAPVIYGGYSGGIVDGHTRRARRDESLVDIDLNLLQTGGLVRTPVPFLDATVTAAARIGYPGVILSLATDQVSLSYWDYQFRLDGGTTRNGWTVFAYGANDELDTPAPDADPADPTPPLEPSLILTFHRLDLRVGLGSGIVDTAFRVVSGIDQTLSQGSDVSTWVVEPSARMRLRLDPTLDLVAGLEGSYKGTNVTSANVTSDNFTLDTFTEDLSRQATGSGFVEALWRPTRDWLVRPGVRSDVFHDQSDTVVGVDPRLTLRYRLLSLAPAGETPDEDADALWLKAAVGIFHQPPRFFLPLPGLDTMPLSYGLLQAIQYDLGAEAPLWQGFSVNVDVYYNDMDPLVFDLAVNEADVNNVANVGLLPPAEGQPTQADEVLDQLLVPQVGRAYGLEVLLRHEARQGLYGWLSYTLSRSERQRDGNWVLHDFDRTHLINVVAGLPLPRNWDLGLRLQYQSGKPTTTTAGYNTARTDGYARIDLRVDKRAVWQDWLLDFYVDVTNVALLPEEVSAGQPIRYVLPTIGLRGRL